MTHHQIHNVWDFVAIGLVWLIGFAYKSITALFIWVAGLFHFQLSIDLAGVNEVIHLIVLVLGGILTLVKLLPIVLKWFKGKRKFSKKTRKR